MKLSLGFSPCPNDTYIFDAIVNNRINLKGYGFDVEMADIEQLNRNAFAHIFDITKLSFHAFAHVSENYMLLPAGAALGFGNGPLLISKHRIYPDEVSFVKIAIPGVFTTAAMLLYVFWQPDKKNIREYLFSSIEEVVLSGEADAGLIIHETRFTYQKKGLLKIADLGEMWEKETHKPLPLGGIAIKRMFPDKIKNEIAILIKESIEFANRFPEASKQFIQKHARETSKQITKQHIQLYVNEFSTNLGTKGEEAINHLLKSGFEKKITPKVVEPVFV